MLLWTKSTIFYYNLGLVSLLSGDSFYKLTSYKGNRATYHLIAIGTCSSGTFPSTEMAPLAVKISRVPRDKSPAKLISYHCTSAIPIFHILVNWACLEWVTCVLKLGNNETKWDHETRCRLNNCRLQTLPCDKSSVITLAYIQGQFKQLDTLRRTMGRCGAHDAASRATRAAPHGPQHGYIDLVDCVARTIRVSKRLARCEAWPE